MNKLLLIVQRYTVTQLWLYEISNNNIIIYRSSSKPQFVKALSNLINCKRNKSSSSSSTSSSDSDTENKEVKKDVTAKPKNQALEKLNVLLKQMINVNMFN